HEQQNQRVSRVHVRLDLHGRYDNVDLSAHRGFPFATGNFAAQLVGHAARCDLNQPTAWIFGNAFLRPLREGRYHGFLHRVLGGGEVAKAASDSAERLRCKFAQQMLGGRVPRLCHRSSRYSISGGGPLIIGRTSMGMFKGFPPGPGAADTFAAIAQARSGISTSTIQYPARNSLLSGNMPSVIGKPSLLALTSIAWSGKDRPSAETNSPDWRSSLLRPTIKAICAWRSFCGHSGTPWPARIVFIMMMYFIFILLL